MYPASIDDVVTVSCFFEDQVTELLLTSNTKLLIDLWSLGSWAQLESIYLMRLKKFFPQHIKTKLKLAVLLG